MDEEARRIYDTLNRYLTAERPDAIYTADEIGFEAANYLGSTFADMRLQREGAIEFAQATVSDADKREQAANQVNRFFDQKEHDFERHFTAAVKEIHRENGFSFEDNVLDDREPKTVPIYSREQEAQVKREDEQKIELGSPHGYVGRAKFAERTSQLPEREEGEKQHDGGPKGRETDEQQRGDLTPKQQLIPPREFIERHSRNMTRDDYAAALGISPGGAGSDPERTPPPERQMPERGRSRNGHDFDR